MKRYLRSKRSSSLFLQKKIIIPFLLLGVAFIFPACNKFSKTDWFQYEKNGKHDQRDPAVLLLWNDAAMQAVDRINLLSTNGPMPPMPESRIYAMINVAMYDALNSIVCSGKSYALFQSFDKNASVIAAVSSAAHDVLVALLPPETYYADSLLQVSLSVVPDGSNKQKGINAGKAAAAAMLVKRANDGADNAQTAYVQGTLPGEYRSTPPFDGAPFNGFVAVPGWGNITPFGLSGSSQFRPGAPYAISSTAYTTDYNEVKNLGAAVNGTRTAEQTEIALFWVENCPHGWNNIARTLIANKHIDIWNAARLFALLHIAIADANISAFEAKFYYNFWRPITAIRLGDTDGNSGTVGDASWDVLAPPTPPVPDYPSNHATNGAAAAEVLKLFFNNDNISFNATSTSLPNVTRHYKSFSQAARDNTLSRIYVGYHFRNACMTGEALGRLIGKYDFEHCLK